jgi:glyoxylase-like metal-dependent hydrolase (beta-lactamase superfamily II)
MLTGPASPDASLTQDESYTATSHLGLTYPLGDFAPGKGEAHRIAPGISWARIPMPGSLGHINTWLLDEGDGVAVVDTGMRLQMCGDAWKALFAGDLAERPIRRVIGTHLHPDHIGLAGWLCKKADVDLWMTRAEWLTARLMTSDARDETPLEVLAMQRSAGWDDAALAESKKAGWGQFARVIYPLPLGYRRLQHGDVLDLGGNRWRIVVGSGHSPEHACLWNEASGVLVSGDQVLPRISSNVSVMPTEPEADPLCDWLTSIDRLLLELPDDLLVCPAHGEPFHGLHVRLKALRDEHHKRLDDLAAFIAEPKRTVDSFHLLFNRPITKDNQGMATGEAIAHFRHLERQGRARREDRDGVRWYHAA